MDTHATGAVKNGLIAKLNTRKWSFLVAFLVVFLISVGGLNAADLLPDAPGTPRVTNTPEAQAPSAATVSQATVGELPMKVEIPAIHLSATVANPSALDTEVLDNDLLYGAVRYPTSGTLGVDGTNVVLFGHSSYLPIVHNQAYKTFDGIQTLKQGDQIMVSSGTKTYVYAVDTVSQANTATDGIPVTVTGSKLTLVTCDSFATKSDRYVVMASLVESYPSGA